MNNLSDIICEKCILRPITRDDTPAIVKWRNNPRVYCNFIFREKFTEEIHNNWIRTRIAAGEVIQYIIFNRDHAVPVGSVYYRDIDRSNKSAEFGIFIGEDFARGKGIGLDATKHFVKYGLEELCLHRVQLRYIRGNIAAEKCYTEAGFIREGIFRDMVFLDGEYKDIVFMSIIGKT